MFKKLLGFSFLTFVVLSSCNYKVIDYQAIQDERDSIAQEMEEMHAEMESYFATINLIQQNIDKIKNAEKVISLLSPEDENDIDNRNKINDDLVFISEMLRANKDEIKQLKAQLKTSSFKFIELEKTVARLTKALDEETVKVKMLMQRLEEKDSLITRLHVDIEDLTGNIDSLEQEKEEHLSQIEEQDATIHTAWYVFGTKKELKEQKIITSEGWFRPSRVLESDFNKNYFVRIDTRNTHAIPLYSTKAKILSTHPKASYSLEKENGTLTLLITERKEFWSVSSYLVIEVD